MACMKKAVVPEAAVEVVAADTLVSEPAVIQVWYTVHVQYRKVALILFSDCKSYQSSGKNCPLTEKWVKLLSSFLM